MWLHKPGPENLDRLTALSLSFSKKPANRNYQRPVPGKQAKTVSQSWMKQSKLIMRGTDHVTYRICSTYSSRLYLCENEAHENTKKSKVENSRIL